MNKQEFLRKSKITFELDEQGRLKFIKGVING